jgi:hypothetical protein
MPSEPSELERVLAALDLRARNMLNDERQKEYADAARLLRAMAADFDRLAIHGAHSVPGRENTGCEKDWQTINGECQCGLDEARRRWKL